MYYYGGYILGVVLLAPIFALVGMLAARMTGFRAQYLAALISTAIGYALITVVGLFICYVLSCHGNLPRFIAGFSCMTISHAVMLKSREDGRLGFGKAIVVTLSQLACGCVIVLVAQCLLTL